jgi:uncharacterized protein with von Willebrand factor type A (vWA) domain
MPFIRYSRWDGTQNVDLDADELLSAMADDLIGDGDLESALRRLMQRGFRQPQGQRMPGLQDLMERLRRRRQQQLDRYDLGSVMEDIKKKLEQVVQTERQGIDRKVAEAQERAKRGEGAEADRKSMEQLAQRRKGALDRLPPDMAGQLKQLQKYDFVDPDARRMFEELLNSLREQMMKPMMQGMQQALQGMTPQDLARMREMLRDLNRMMRDAADGREPDFDSFKQKWGDQFPGVESFEQLLDQLGRQAAAMQSLMQSLSPGQRQQLDEMMRSLFMQDERLEAEMRQLAMNLDSLLPLDEMSRRYPFRGDDELGLKEAMEVMEEMGRLDQLERQLRGVREPGDLEDIDPADVEKALGEESARDLERLRELTRKLEEAGYLERKGDELELTARAIRKIGEKALGDIFAHLKRDRFGHHAVDHRGAGGDRTDDTKHYEFGDPFLLDLKETLMNGVRRNGSGAPVQLVPTDFEVYRTELQTHAATVVMLDMSRSMINNGCFLAAKKVALALHALIKGQFPRDSLSFVIFSLYAREFDAQDLPRLTWSDWSIGTNMHAGFQLSRQLLARHKTGNKQIIMITDGEPTAHMENGEADFAYPPTMRTLQETLKEVQRCTRERITINTFMLEQSRTLTAFVEQMARINRGRAFFANPDRLGEYVLADFVRARRTRI